MSTATSDVYQNPDGTLIEQVSALPVNYQALDGSWLPIDDTLHSDSKGGFESGFNAWTADFAAVGPDQAGVTIDTPSGPLSWDPAGMSASVTPTQTGPSQVTYTSVWPGVDLVYDVTTAGVEEHLLLTSAASPTSFPFTLSGVAVLTPGATPGVGGGGVASAPHAVNSGGFSAGTKGEFTRPFTQEADGRGVDDTDASLSASGSSMTVAVSSSWLKSLPSSAFPLDVDPSWSESDGQIENYESNGTSGSYGVNGQLVVLAGGQEKVLAPG